MNDVSVLSGQISRLKEKLEQKEQLLDQMTLDQLKERVCVNQLIQRLTLACRGHDRELDNKLAHLRQILDTDSPLSQHEELLQSIEKVLQQHIQRLEESWKELADAMQESVQQLSGTKLIPEKLRKESRELMSDNGAFALVDRRVQLTRLLDCYRQAVRALMLRPDTNLVSFPKPASPESTAQTDETEQDHAKLQTRLCDELQRLITELDFTGQVGDELAELRRQLLFGIELAKLPMLCLRLIELVITGARQERRDSHLFIASLNDTLTALHLQLNESLDEGRDLHAQLGKSDQAMFEQLGKMQQHLQGSMTLEELKPQLISQMIQLHQLLQERQQQILQEKRLLESMTLMENKIHLMKEETAGYKKRLAQQKHRLLLDTLTQVNNRAAFDERIDLEFKRWLRYQTPLCLAIIDIDHFKAVNDRFGHLAGDKALKVIARAMSRTLRESDFLARYGGEEFVVLLPGTDMSNIERPLNKLRNVVKTIPFRFHDQKVEITISIGTTLFRSGDSPHRGV